MVHFFGILTPQTGAATLSDEAPRKRAFFGGTVETATQSRVEADWHFLNGKAPEPDEDPVAFEEKRIAYLSFPPYL